MYSLIFVFYEIYIYFILTTTLSQAPNKGILLLFKAYNRNAKIRQKFKAKSKFSASGASPILILDAAAPGIVHPWLTQTVQFSLYRASEQGRCQCCTCI